MWSLGLSFPIPDPDRHMMITKKKKTTGNPFTPPQPGNREFKSEPEFVENTQTASQFVSSHLLCPRPPSCRRTGGLSAGSLLRLAVLPAALPSSAGPLLPQTSAVQTDSARCTRTQTGQLRLHPAPLEKCCYLKKDYMSSFSLFVTSSLLGSLLKVISLFFVLCLFEWDFMFSVSKEYVCCFILLTKRIFFLKWFQFELWTAGYCQSMVHSAAHSLAFAVRFTLFVFWGFFLRGLKLL